MCDWVPIEGIDTREVGPNPTPRTSREWQSHSPASPQEPARGSSLPPKAGSQANAHRSESARSDGKADLKWPGGRAGIRIEY